MFSLLFIRTVSEGKSPLIIFHGLTGSSLHAYYSNYAKYYYCPKKMNGDMIWHNATMLSPKLSTCFWDLMTTIYDKETQTARSYPNLKVVPGASSMSSFINYFVNNGYTKDKDIYAAVYDWRVGILPLKETFYPSIQKKIEEMYVNNGNKKVSLLGFSLGSHVIHYFTTKFVTPEWRDKYLDQFLLMAPAIAGSTESLAYLWDGSFLGMPENDIMRKAVRTFGSAYVLLPNPTYYHDDPIVYGPKNEVFNASQFRNLILQKKIMTPEMEDIEAANEEIYAIEKQYPGIPVTIIYNTAHKTAFAMNFTSNWKTHQHVYGEGDGTVPSLPIQRLCESWKKVGTCDCTDGKNNTDLWKHGKFDSNPQIQQFFFNKLNPAA